MGVNSTPTKEESINNPVPALGQKLRWRWIIAIACVLGAISAALLFSNRRRQLEFTNGSGKFQIESVTLSKGTKHADYFPNRNQYLLTRIVPWPKWRPSVPGQKLENTTSVESTGLWIRWRSSTGQLQPVHIKIHSSTFPPPEPNRAGDIPIPFLPGQALNKPLFQKDTNSLGDIPIAVNQPFTKSGLFLFVLNTNVLPMEDIVVRTPEGDATIHFK